MNIFRLVQSVYMDDLSGRGAFLHGGRWNSKGEYALYASSHISLAILEIVVNVDRELLRKLAPFHLITLDLPDDLVLPFNSASLKKGWQEDLYLSQHIGDGFLHSQSCPAMSVPSAVVPEGMNYLINPLHHVFGKIQLLSTEEYPLDIRLST